MAITIELGDDEIRDAADAKGSEMVSEGSWRWGTNKTYVFKHEDGHHYRFTVQCHSQEGWQLYGSTTCTRVVQEPKTVMVWVEAKP